MKNAKYLMYCLSAALLTSCSEGALKLDSIAALSVDTVAGELPFGTEEMTITVSGGVAPYTFATVDKTPGILENFSRAAANQFNFRRPWNSGSATLRVTDAIGNIQDSVLTLSAGAFNFVGGVTLVNNELSETVTTQLLRDANGDFIICGTTTGKVEASILNKKYGNKDIFLAKISSRGKLEWITQVEAGTGSQSSNPMIALSSSGEIFLAGSTTGNFAGGVTSSENTFLTKYTDAGDSAILHPSYPKRMLGVGDIITNPVQILVDASDDVLIVGTSTGDIIGGTYIGGFSSDSNQDVFLAKFSPSGENFVWIISLDAGSNDYTTPVRMVAVPNSNILVAGYTAGLVGDTAINPGGDVDTFLILFNSDGQKVESAQLGGGVGSTQPTAMQVYSDRIFISGYTEGFIGGTTVGVGQKDFYLAGYDFTDYEVGDLATPYFRYQFGAAAFSESSPRHMQASSDGIFVVGTTTGTFGSNLGGVGTLGNTSAFMAKFAYPSGNFVWANQLGGGTGSTTSPLKVHIGTDNIFVAGTTDGNFNLIDASQLGGNGNIDSYIAKYNLDGTAVIWSRQLGSTNATLATLNDVLIDSLENSFLLGTFNLQGQVNLQGQIEGAFNLDNSLGATNSYLVKFNSDGTLQ